MTLQRITEWDLELPGTISADLTLLRGGVYFWIRNGFILYVGTAICFGQRFHGHHLINEKYWMEGDEVRLLFIDDNMERLQTERHFIDKYNPPYNGDTRMRALQEDKARTMAMVEAQYPSNEFFSIGEAASIAGVSTGCITSLARSGVIPAVTTGQGGHGARRLIPKARFMFLFKSRKIDFSRSGLNKKLLDIGTDLAIIEAALIAAGPHPHPEAT